MYIVHIDVVDREIIIRIVAKKLSGQVLTYPSKEEAKNVYEFLFEEFTKRGVAKHYPGEPCFSVSYSHREYGTSKTPAFFNNQLKRYLTKYSKKKELASLDEKKVPTAKEILGEELYKKFMQERKSKTVGNS